MTSRKNAKRWTVGCLTFPVGRRDPRVRRRNSRKELLVMARIITIKHALPWTAKRNPRLYRYALGVYNELLWALGGPGRLNIEILQSYSLTIKKRGLYFSYIII